MRSCSICGNFRFIIIDDKPVPCYKCNPKRKYRLRSQVVCLGCGKPSCGGCPCGTRRTLVKQD